ncbi:MAG: hypothetical protein KAG56_11325 [Sulfurovaceae bacterium]|nr:hypothetical protein [Sulfurovaceae bacterium]
MKLKSRSAVLSSALLMAMFSMPTSATSFEVDEPLFEKGVREGKTVGMSWAHLCDSSKIREIVVFDGRAPDWRMVDKVNVLTEDGECALAVKLTDKDAHETGWYWGDPDLREILTKIENFSRLLDAPIYFNSIRSVDGTTKVKVPVVAELTDKVHNDFVTRVYLMAYEDGWRAGVHDDWTYNRGFNSSTYMRGGSNNPSITLDRNSDYRYWQRKN